VHQHGDHVGARLQVRPKSQGVVLRRNRIEPAGPAIDVPAIDPELVAGIGEKLKRGRLGQPAQLELTAERGIDLLSNRR